MTCDSAHELIQPYLDQELDPSQTSEMEAHLRTCVACAEFHHELTELRNKIRVGAPYFRAPQGLEGRIREALRQEARPSHQRSPWAWVAAAASLGFAAAMIWGIVLLRSESLPPVLAQEIVSSHVRSLMPGHLFDVPSTDRHTVKPWFNGKLDFSPRVVDLTDEGFPLTGGRLDYLDNRPVAALVYQRRKHIINLFVWPSPEASGDHNAPSTRSGFTIVHWTEQGLGYWAVSDLAADELREFARLYQRQ